MRLINGISSEFQKLFKYFEGTAFVVFFKILLTWFGADWASVFSNNLALYLKDWKLLALAIFVLKLVASIF